jgi:hypothetical protein
MPEWIAPKKPIEKLRKSTMTMMIGITSIMAEPFSLHIEDLRFFSIRYPPMGHIHSGVLPLRFYSEDPDLRWHCSVS